MAKREHAKALRKSPAGSGTCAGIKLTAVKGACGGAGSGQDATPSPLLAIARLPLPMPLVVVIADLPPDRRGRGGVLAKNTRRQAPTTRQAKQKVSPADATFCSFFSTTAFAAETRPRLTKVHPSLPTLFLHPRSRGREKYQNLQRVDPEHGVPVGPALGNPRRSKAQHIRFDDAEERSVSRGASSVSSPAMSPAADVGAKADEGHAAEATVAAKGKRGRGKGKGKHKAKAKGKRSATAQASTPAKRAKTGSAL